MLLGGGGGYFRNSTVHGLGPSTDHCMMCFRAKHLTLTVHIKFLLAEKMLGVEVL